MKQLVIMPGGFHPFHAGHMALYTSAKKAFPEADVYVAATNDTSERPFPFSIKQKLARVAGVDPSHFVQVKSPFSAEEITSRYDPNDTILIFVKSEKNAKGGPDPEGPFPAEIDPKTGKLPLVTRGANKGKPVSDRLQYYKGNENNLQPMSRHSYLAYLPTVEFGPGITSGSQIRKIWPDLSDKRRLALVMSLYPVTQKNPKLAQNVVQMIDIGMSGQIDEGWKDWVVGGMLGLSAAGAAAQGMPNINTQQVELANKYYAALVQRAKEDGRELDTRTLNFLKAKAQDAAIAKTQQNKSQSQPNKTFPSQGSERTVAKDITQFQESKDYLDEK